MEVSRYSGRARCLRTSLPHLLLVHSILLFVDSVDGFRSGIRDVDLKRGLADGEVFLIYEPNQLMASIISDRVVLDLCVHYIVGFFKFINGILVLLITDCKIVSCKLISYG